jgi:hypothetical protein
MSSMVVKSDFQKGDKRHSKTITQQIKVIADMNLEVSTAKKTQRLSIKRISW